MKNLTYIILAAFCLGTIACEKTSTLDLNGSVVVSGYLFNGRQIDSLRVTLSNLYNGDSTLSTLDNLEISIEGPDSRSILSPIGLGFYESVENNFLPDTEYTMYFEYDGEEIRAETYVPPITEISISDTVVHRAKVVAGGGFPGAISVDNLEVSWSNPTGNHYYALVTNLESDPEIINERLANRPQIFRRTEPQITDVFIVNGRQDIQYFGRHMVVVYRLNPEYVALYETRGSSSISIEDPPSNVENGLGIFTGISTDTVFFHVYEE